MAETALTGAADQARPVEDPPVGAARAAWPAIAIYLGVRIFSVLVLAAFARPLHEDVFRILDGQHDSVWYEGIVVHGYDRVLVPGPHGHPLTSNLAFFPLYPALIRLFAAVPGLSTPIAALVVSWLAGIAAAWGIFAVGALLKGRRAGIMLVALWTVLPHSIVQSTAYSETLFAALAAWTIHATLTRRWVLAGALSLLAGLSRPTANAVVVMVLAAALVAIVRRRDGWRPWLALVLAPLGYVGFLAFVGQRLGSLDGYLRVQRDAWGTSFDGGAYTWRMFTEYLHGERLLEQYVVSLVIVVTLVMYVLMVLDRPPWELIVFTTVALAVVLMVSGAYLSKGRFLMPIFPVLLPAAGALAKVRTRSVVPILAGLALIAAWFGCYLLVTWTWSP